MGHLPLAGEHGVLVGTEPFQSGGDELIEPDEGLVAVDRPRPVGWRTPEIVVQVGDDGPVDVVEFEAGELRPCPAVPGRRFAVVVIEVPATADRLAVRFDQHVEAVALPSVEVLHLEVASVTNPGGKVVVVAEELAIGDEFDICLLYTSDAADERSSVDLGGRRIIKKKKQKHKKKKKKNKKKKHKLQRDRNDTTKIYNTGQDAYTRQYTTK